MAKIPPLLTWKHSTGVQRGTTRREAAGNQSILEQRKQSTSMRSPIEAAVALNRANGKKRKSAESYSDGIAKRKKEHRDEDDGDDVHGGGGGGGDPDDDADQLGVDETSLLTVRDAFSEALKRIRRKDTNLDVRAVRRWRLLSWFIREIDIIRKIKRKDGCTTRRGPLLYARRGALMRRLTEVNRIARIFNYREGCSFYIRDHQMCRPDCSLRPGFMKEKITAEMVLFFVPRSVRIRLLDVIGQKPWEEYRPFFDTLIRLIWSLESPSLDPFKGLKEAKKKVQNVISELGGHDFNRGVKRRCIQHLKVALGSMKW